jgi:hypothetical protein
MLSNQQVLDMVRDWGKKACVEYLLKQSSGTSSQSMYSKVKRLKNKVSMLKKTMAKQGTLDALLRASFFPAPPISEQAASHRSGEARLRSQHSALKLRLKIQRAELRRKGSQSSFYFRKICKLEANEVQLKKKIRELEEEHLSLMEKLSSQQQRLAAAEGAVELLKADEDHHITTKASNGHFTNQVKECVFHLLDCNVSTGQVAGVMESVLNFAEVSFDDLPSKSTVNEWHVSRLILAQHQVRELLGPRQNLCLLSDETSKFGIKYQGFHASTSAGGYVVLGLRNIASKAGTTVLSTLTGKSSRT